MELRILIFAFLAASVVSSPVPSKQYRHDYEYNKNTDAFYKLHTDGASKFDALGKCIEEGAELVNILSDEDLKQVYAMMKKLSDLEEYVMVIFDAFSDEPPSDFECNVVNRRGKIDKTTASQELPFVCKVAANDAPYNKECGVYSNDYESRTSTTGSCYRVSTDEVTWNEAHAKCQAEGAHLVILSNDKELKVLYNMLKDKPHNSQTQYFAGVRADTESEPRVFKTVFNQTLEEVGYGPWEEGEPNEYEGGEYCVALDTRRHGKYNDAWCHVRMPYICESSGPKQEVSTTSSTTSHVGPVAEWGTGCEVVRRSGDIATVHCWRQAPFVCKVQAQAAYNHDCDVFDKDYISKISTTGSCYKVSTHTVPWNEASAECAAENAHLVVLNSEGEHEVVRDFLSSQLPVELTEIFFFAGIRADRPIDGAPRIFRTVQLNQTLDEAGYSEWSENEPNNYQDSEYCGSIYKVDGKYNDLSCSRPHGFICEKEMRAVL